MFLPDAACPDRTRGILKDIILGKIENFGEIDHAFHIIGSDRAKYHFDTDRTEKELGLIFQNRFDQYH